MSDLVFLDHEKIPSFEWGIYIYCTVRMVASISASLGGFKMLERILYIRKKERAECVCVRHIANGPSQVLESLSFTENDSRCLYAVYGKRRRDLKQERIAN